MTYICQKIDYDISLTTKNGQSIDIEIHKINDAESLWTQYVFKAFVGGVSAGYLLTQYIDDDTKSNQLNTFMKSWMYHYGNEDIINAWNNDKLKFVMLMRKKLNIQEDCDLAFIEKNIFDIHHKKYQRMLDQYYNKPCAQIVCVYTENDKDKNFAQFPHVHEKRQAVNFQKQGISTALYFCAAQFFNEKNLNIFSSLTQTEEGKKMWASFKKVKKISIKDNGGRQIIKII